MNTPTVLEIERRRQGLTATELAGRMKVGRPLLSEVERGHRRPSAEFKRKAARALGLSVKELWPSYYFVASSSENRRGLLAEGVRPIVFTDAEEARLHSQGGGRVDGPVGLDFFSQLLGLSAEAVREFLLVDPSAATVSTATQDGEAP